MAARRQVSLIDAGASCTSLGDREGNHGFGSLLPPTLPCSFLRSARDPPRREEIMKCALRRVNPRQCADQGAAEQPEHPTARNCAHPHATCDQTHGSHATWDREHMTGHMVSLRFTVGMKHAVKSPRICAVPFTVSVTQLELEYGIPIQLSLMSEPAATPYLCGEPRHTDSRLIMKHEQAQAAAAPGSAVARRRPYGTRTRSRGGNGYILGGENWLGTCGHGHAPRCVAPQRPKLLYPSRPTTTT